MPDNTNDNSASNPTTLNESHTGDKAGFSHSFDTTKSINSSQGWGTGGDNPPSGGSAIVAAPQAASQPAAAQATPSPAPAASVQPSDSDGHGWGSG